MRIFRQILSIGAALLCALPAWAANHPDAPETVPGAPSYVQFLPIFIPIIQGDRVTRQIGLRLTLELTQGEEKSAIEDKRRQLNDAFIRDLYAFFQQRAGVDTSDIDETYLKQRLLEVADNIVGDKAVREVLIQQFFEQLK